MKNIILFFGIIAPFFAYSQSSWELGANVGAANYQGDIVETNIFTPKETNLDYGAFLRRNFNDHWGLRLNAMLGNISGDDANFDERKKRAYSFESPVTELSLRLEFNMLKREKTDGSRRKIIPYLLAGAGYTLYDPTTEYSIATKNLDQQTKIADDKTNLEKNVISFPLGAGFKFPLSDKWTLSLEGTMNPTLGDYVDGVSASGDPNDNDWLAFGTLGLAYRFGKMKDTDGDGISDRKDKCPDVAGVVENMGCPADRDGDGVYDSADKCPDMAGVAANMGCPADRDGDGVYDKDDKCPDVKGIAANMGCPSDRDKDGINDADDKCPDLAGIAANKGCPADRDGDGVYDTDDKCPDVKGVAANAGCPSDRDKDGIYDTDDKCPDLAGIIANMGCPSDRDKDGVYDANDRCPDVPGLTTNGGCPELKAEDKKVLDLAVKNVNFETSKAVLTAGSYKILDQVADILSRYNYYSVAIEGHTDNQGDDAKNLTLSQNRAKACYDYLVKKGVATSRMSHNGYGETKPVATNDTAEGRRQNRRVEFNLSVK